MPTPNTIVLFSGGLDSTVCLYWALKTYGPTLALTFDYGQSYPIELTAARRICQLAGVPQVVLPADTFAALAMLNPAKNPSAESEPGLPNDTPPRYAANFVPGRNLIFFTFAAAYGWQHGIHRLVGGMTQIDQAAYPDCRPNALNTLEKGLCAGLDAPFEIKAPLLQQSKAETIRMAKALGAWEALAWTHTCYRGLSPPCQWCPPCLLRRQGFVDAGMEDPLWQRVGGGG